MNDQINKANDEIRRERFEEQFERIAASRLNKTPKESLVVNRNQFRFGSYAANLFSVLTAIYAVYYTSTDFTGEKAFGALLLGMLVLVAIEHIKRQTAVGVARDKYAFAAVFIAFAALSMSISYYGGSKYITTESTKVEKQVNPEIAELKAEVDKIDAHDAEMVAAWKKWENKETKKWPVAAFQYMTEGGQKQANSRKATLLAEIDRLKAEDDATWRAELGEQDFRLTNLGVATGTAAVICDLALFFFMFRHEKIDQEIANLKKAELRKEQNAERNETERENRTQNAPGDFIPARNSERDGDLLYRQRTGRVIAELREELDALKKENDELKMERSVRSKAVTANGNGTMERNGKTERRTQNGTKANAEKAKRRTPPKWIGTALSMRKNGSSLQEIADALGKSKSTIHRWLNT